jgi:hypothetical protein
MTPPDVHLVPAKANTFSTVATQLPHRQADTKPAAGRQSLLYEHFLQATVFRGLRQTEHDRTPEARALIGEIKYLNGGLFMPHRIEQDYPGIR